MKKIVSFFLVMAFLASCSTSNQVVSNKLFQKRKYKKGWHVNTAPKIDKSTKVESQELAIIDGLEKSESEDVDSKSTNQKELAQTDNKPKALSSKTNIKDKTNVKNELARSNKNSESEDNSTLIVSSDPVVPVQKESALSKLNSLETSSKEESSSNSNSEVGLVLMIILAFLLPPLAVFLARGIGTEFWISVLLTILFWAPGIIYALLIILDII